MPVCSGLAAAHEGLVLLQRAQGPWDEGEMQLGELSPPCTLCSCSAQGYPALLILPSLLWHRQDLPRASAATTKSQKSRRFRTCLKLNKWKAGTATGTLTFQTHFSKYEIPNTFRALGFVIWKGGIWFQWQLKKAWLWKIQYILQLTEILCSILNCKNKGVDRRLLNLTCRILYTPWFK